MAGDWIKVRGNLVDHPKVVAIARRLQADPSFREWLTPGGGGLANGQLVSDVALRCVTTALLIRLWCASREHGKWCGPDLNLAYSTIDDLDQIAGCPGLGAAMEYVGWAVNKDGVTLPNFIEFNVPMTSAEKQAQYRDRKKSDAKCVTNALPTRSNENADSVTTREEKRRYIDTSLRSVSRARAQHIDAPTDEHVALAAQLGIPCQAEFEKYKDYFAAKGKRHADEVAGFRNWLRRSASYRSAPAVAPVATIHDKRAAKAKEMYGVRASDAGSAPIDGTAQRLA